MSSPRSVPLLVGAAAVFTVMACGDAAEEETVGLRNNGEAGKTAKGGSAGRVGGNDLPGGSSQGGKASSGTGGAAGSGASQAKGGAPSTAGAGGEGPDEEDGGSGGSAGGSGGAASGGTSSGGAGGEASGGTSAAGAGGSAGSANPGGSGGTAAVPECAYATVNTPGTTLNVRPDPSTNGAVVAVLPDNTVLEVLEKVNGQAVDGTPVWYKIKGGGAEGYGYSKFIECSATKPPDPPPLDGFYLPLACGMKVLCTQGNNGAYSHTGNIKYAFDFSLGANTPLRAAAPGTVVAIYNSTVPGSPCYNGGDKNCSPYSNYVLIRHSDNTQTIYKHLNKVEVAVGQVVARGQHIGLSGKTGYASGNHVHIMRQNAGPYNAASIPMTFSDAGVPSEGQTVTSGNCP